LRAGGRLAIVRTMHRAKALLDRTASGIEGRLVLAEDARKGC